MLIDVICGLKALQGLPESQESSATVVLLQSSTDALAELS
jgi:hypothetical protein